MEDAQVQLGEARRSGCHLDFDDLAVGTEAARHYGEAQLAALILAISQINVWNRLNVGAGVVAGEWNP